MEKEEALPFKVCRGRILDNTLYILSLQCYSDVTHKLAKYLADEKLLSIVITDSSASEYYKDYEHGVAQPGDYKNLTIVTSIHCHIIVIWFDRGL